jgi:hypothetical protein
MTLRKVLIYSGEPELALKESIVFDREICVDALLGQESAVADRRKIAVSGPICTGKTGRNRRTLDQV